MKQMTVRSPYGVDITVYEVMHESKVYWFTEDALMYAERLYRAANQPRDLDDLNWQFNGDGSE